MNTPEIPLYKPLSSIEKNDLVTIARSAKEINDWVSILLAGHDVQNREKIISHVLREVKKIKFTTIEE